MSRLSFLSQAAAAVLRNLRSFSHVSQGVECCYGAENGDKKAGADLIPSRTQFKPFFKAVYGNCTNCSLLRLQQ